MQILSFLFQAPFLESLIQIVERVDLKHEMNHRSCFKKMLKISEGKVVRTGSNLKLQSNGEVKFSSLPIFYPFEQEV